MADSGQPARADDKEVVQETEAEFLKRCEDFSTSLWNLIESSSLPSIIKLGVLDIARQNIYLRERLNLRDDFVGRAAPGKQPSDGSADDVEGGSNNGT